MSRSSSLSSKERSSGTEKKKKNHIQQTASLENNLATAGKAEDGHVKPAILCTGVTPKEPRHTDHEQGIQSSTVYKRKNLNSTRKKMNKLWHM